MKKVLLTFAILSCLLNVEIYAQSKVKEKDQVAARNNVKGQKVKLQVSKEGTKAIVWLCDLQGKQLTDYKSINKETGTINGMNVAEFGGVNYIFEIAARNDYPGIQGFPEVDKKYAHPRLDLKGTLNLPDVVIINQNYFKQIDIERLVLSPYIKKINEYAFYKCEKLTEVVFPEGCSDFTIDRHAFEGCNNLREIVFPEGCGNISIDKTAFINCNKINKIVVPKGRITEFANMMQLSENLFDDGSAILDYSIEVEKPSTILEKLPLDKLKEIRSLKVVGILDENDLEVIKGCVHLKVLDLSNAYTTLSQAEQIQRKANTDFLKGLIQSLGKVSQDKYENGEISTIDNLQVQLFSKLVKGSSDVKEASVGCIIPTGAFSKMTHLEKVILPIRASEIESKAFQDCPNLKEVILPPYLRIIGTGAFAFCTKLKNIIFPETLSSIGMYDQQHTYGKSAAASFVETGVEKLDFSNCYFKSNAIDNSWSYRFHCKNLKVVKLPHINHIDVGFGSDSPVICYVPSSVKRLNIYDRTIKEIHFSSLNPPYVESGLRNCIIYVPKGSLTQYYAKFKGDGNTFKEDN